MVNLPPPRWRFLEDRAWTLGRCGILETGGLAGRSPFKAEPTSLIVSSLPAFAFRQRNGKVDHRFLAPPDGRIWPTHFTQNRERPGSGPQPRQYVLLELFIQWLKCTTQL